QEKISVRAYRYGFRPGAVVPGVVVDNRTGAGEPDDAAGHDRRRLRVVLPAGVRGSSTDDSEYERHQEADHHQMPRRFHRLLPDSHLDGTRPTTRSRQWR